MSIKKAFQPVVDFLETNKGSKVSTIFDQVVELCSAKSGGAGGEPKFIKNATGVITHIFCYYHKMWEPVTADGTVKENDGKVEYGVKATSATGLNTMCKEGTSNWTKQQREAKKANEQLLTDVAGGKVEPKNILAEQDKIANTKSVVTARKDGLGSKDKPA